MKRTSRARRNHRPPQRHRLKYHQPKRLGQTRKHENVRGLYPIDLARVYVGGLSGGSRVAEIAALAFPDVFRGVLLNAGSDPIGGEQGIYLPPPDLFRKFQTTRIVYVTGGEDETNVLDDQVRIGHGHLLDPEGQIVAALRREVPMVMS